MYSRSAVLALVLVGACDDGSGFAGDFEAVSFAREQGSCGGARVDEDVPGNDALFRLADVEVPNGMLVGYYACTEIGVCSELYDLARSFGAAKEDPSEWAGYLSTALPGVTCTLTYRVRTLSRADDGRIQIDTQVFRDTDDTLMSDACNQSVAAERAMTMPCVETSLLVAEDR